MIGTILRPELKKFILPTIFLMLFLFLLNEFYQMGYDGDQYFCDFGYYMKAIEMMKNSEFCSVTGDMIILGNVQIEEETQKRLDRSLEGIVDLTDRWKGSVGDVASRVMIMVDPFFPAPCEMYNAPFCEYYISQTSFECSRLSADEISTDSIKVRIPDYKPASLVSVTLNTLFLIVEGYLISCLLLLPWTLRTPVVPPSKISSPSILSHEKVKPKTKKPTQGKKGK
ncbi:Uncharacterised protein [Candidatus Bilamarchaeum dharawalense]|uniref:Uncharacterized protein n=1 Tax=Candidatus Bilamarchaeum dharawalense TaxID=2885759 RepID=A0A5E4LTX8_9ARCH|nr:Uncharacterised protein [Candidatus Bilamarchaeum dharawalense]